VKVTLEEAKTAALQIKNDFQRGQVLDEIGAAEAKAGDLDSAVDTANRAYPHTMSTLTAIGDQLSATGGVSKARAIGPKLRGGELSTIFAIIARHQAEGGGIEQALHTAEQIEDASVRSYALREIAHKQADAGDYVGARKTLSVANTAYPAQPSPPEETEMTIAQGQIAQGQTEAARQTIASMKVTEMRSLALIAESDALFKKGNSAAARDWLDEGLRTLPAGRASEFSRYFAIPTEVKLGLKERAMQDAGSLSSEMQLKGYSAVATVCAEQKDMGGVRAALEKLRSAAAGGREGKELSEFQAKLMTLNVTAALIEAGLFDEAIGMLSTLEEHVDAVSEMSIEREAQLQRVVALARQGEFNKGQSLALHMRPDVVASHERGTALRTVALLETKANGIASTHQWASALADAEDRAYALLGINQALLGIGDVRLPYSVIQVH
jgi:hypothetical protein